MTRLTVDIHDENEEKALIAFLDSLKYSYTTIDDSVEGGLTPAQEAEALRRMHAYEEGRMGTLSWEEVKERLQKR